MEPVLLSIIIAFLTALITALPLMFQFGKDVILLKKQSREALEKIETSLRDGKLTKAEIAMLAYELRNIEDTLGRIAKLSISFYNTIITPFKPNN